MSNTPPPFPKGHVGGELPQGDTALQQAAAAAVLQPMLPPGLAPMPTPQPAGPVLPPQPFPPPPPQQPLPVTQLQGIHAPAFRPQPVATAPLPPVQPMPVADTHLAPVQALVRQLLNSQVSQQQRFFLVVIPEDNSPRIEQFDELGVLQARIVELLGTEVALYPFLGSWLGISAGPWRYLITPWGNLPLFDVPAPGAVRPDESGWVGTKGQELVIPTRPADVFINPPPPPPTQAGPPPAPEPVPASPAIFGHGDTPIN
jgi:hypothetical protein